MENGSVGLPRANIQILTMEAEIPVTIAAVDSVLCQCREGDVISVLLNGARSSRLRETFEDYPTIRFYESDENLGVAGGRNFLLRTEEAKLARYILFVDNDTLVPCDYVDRTCDLLAQQPGIGVAGCVVFDYKPAKTTLLTAFPTYHGQLKTLQHRVCSAELIEAFRSSPRRNLLYHVGTNNDWRKSYVNNQSTIDAILHELKILPDRTFFSANADNADFVWDLVFYPVPKEVANVPGCCQAFRRSLVDEIGELNQLFNPYGYEDVDFCLRAARAGYRNVVCAHTALFHRTDLRHADRLAPIAWGQVEENQLRAWAILLYLNDRDRFPLNILTILATRFASRGIKPSHRQYEGLLRGWRGFRTALMQIAESCEPEGGGRENGTSEAQTVRRAKDEGRRHFAELGQFEKYLEELDADSSVAGGQAQLLARIQETRVARRGSRSLEAFKNAHVGKRCFIIGNGPSLIQTDLGALTGEITFGVNGIFYMTTETGFRPTYYTVEDNHVVHDNIHQINRVSAAAKFFPDKYRGVILETDETYFLNTDWGFYWRSSPHFEATRFSFDCDQQIYVGQTVTYLNLQLAYYMGFTEVYLIGMDFNYEIPKTAGIENLTILSTEADPNHFHPEYFGAGKRWHFPKLENCLKVYQHAKEVYEADGRRVINATVGGKLEVFPRTPFEQIVGGQLRLEKPNERRNAILKTVLTEISRARGSLRVVAHLTDKVASADLKRIIQAFGGSLTSGAMSTFVEQYDVAVLDLFDCNVGFDGVAGDAKAIVVFAGAEAGTDAVDAAIASGRTVWILGDVFVMQNESEEVPLPLAGFAGKLCRDSCRRGRPSNSIYVGHSVDKSIGLGEWVWAPLGHEYRDLLSSCMRKNVPVSVDKFAIYARI